MYDPWGAENVNDLQPYEVFATHRMEKVLAGLQACFKPTIDRSEPGLQSRLSVGCELLAQSKLDDRLLIPTSEEGGAAAKKCREEEEGSHRGEILRDLSAETQIDSPTELVVP